MKCGAVRHKGDKKMSSFFDIGYNAFKNNEACIPSMNASLQSAMADVYARNNHDEMMQSMREFIGGVNKAQKEWEIEFFANAE